VGNGQVGFTWGTSTPHVFPPGSGDLSGAQAWLRLKGGYVWGESWLFNDKGTIADNGVYWESGVQWNRGAHLYKCTVVLYQHDNFGGRQSSTFDVGDYNKGAMKRRNANNDDATSVKVGPGCTATLYDDDNFKDRKVVLEAGSHELKYLNFNDKTSSLRVRQSR